MTLNANDRRFLKRLTKRDRYLDDLSGMRVFTAPGARSARSARNACSRKTRLPEKVLIKF